MTESLLEVHPPIGQWFADIRDWDSTETVVLAGQSLGDLRKQSCAVLGIESEGRVIMTGHQADFWHPGILVKDFFASLAASHVGGCAIHIVVDQDVNSPGQIVVPVYDQQGDLHERLIQMLSIDNQVPICHRSAQQSQWSEPVRGAALESVETGLRAMSASLNRHVSAENQAVQVAKAVHDLVAEWVTPPQRIFASQLLDTPLGHALIAEMAKNPRAVARAYNTAVRAHSDAGINELIVTDSAVEIPLWRVDHEGRRHRAYSHDLEMDGTFYPRALMMTALARLGLCDLFIHGTGGGRYDRVTEQWIYEWLKVKLAPMAVATASIHLPFRSVQTAGVQAARSAYRRAWHDPDVSEDQTMSVEKQSLLGQINSLPVGSRARRTMFYEMHRILSARRARAESTLAERELLLQQAVNAERERPIRFRRTWAFPLYPSGMIADLLNRCKATLKQDTGAR